MILMALPSAAIPEKSIPAEVMGLGSAEIGRLHDQGVVAGPRR